MTTQTALEFASWLEDHDPDEIVGYAWEIDACPLAEWLGQEVAVPLLPDWAAAFVVHLDGIFSMSKPVSAQEALEVLDWAQGDEYTEGS